MSECECSPTKKFLHFYEIKTVQEEQEQQTVEVDIEPYDLAPAMNGTATAGSSENYARGDHVHPRDTTKVDKVEGMGLSSNDYTSEEKAKLSALRPVHRALLTQRASWMNMDSPSPIMKILRPCTRQ